MAGSVDKFRGGAEVSVIVGHARRESLQVVDKRRLLSHSLPPPLRQLILGAGHRRAPSNAIFRGLSFKWQLELTAVDPSEYAKLSAGKNG